MSYVTTVLRDEPIAYWRMNEETGDFLNTVDLLAPGGPTGLHTAAVLDATNLTYRQTRLVRGATDLAPFLALTYTTAPVNIDTLPQIEVPHHAALDFVGAGAIELWVRATFPGADYGTPPFGGIQFLLSKIQLVGFNLSSGYLLQIAQAGADPADGYRIGWALFRAGTSSSATSDVLAYDQIYHVVVRRADDDTMDLIINGHVNVASSSPVFLDGSAAASVPLKFGACQIPLPTAPIHVGAPNAIVAHVAFYDHFLTDARVRTHYRAGFGAISGWMAML